MGYICQMDDNDNAQFIKVDHKQNKCKNKKCYKKLQKLKKKSKRINRRQH